jgi:hypothetical protein
MAGATNPIEGRRYRGETDQRATRAVPASVHQGPSTPLSEAANVGDEAVVRLLIERGADVKSAGAFPTDRRAQRE